VAVGKELAGPAKTLRFLRATYAPDRPMVNCGIRDGYPSRPIGGNYTDIFRTRRETGG